MFNMKQPNAKHAVIVIASIMALSFSGCLVKKDKKGTDKGVEISAGALEAEVVNNIPIDNTLPITLNLGALPIKGNINAPVTILEFSDYECPFCSRVEPTIKQIMDTYPGQVRVAFVNFPLGFHKNAMHAAKTGVAAHNQGKFWPVHEAMFADNKNLSEASLRAIAEKHGLDMARYDADIANPATEAFINKGMADAAKHDIKGTPAFLINGVFLSGAQPFDNFKEIIDKEIERAKTVKAEKNLDGEALYRELFNSAAGKAEVQAEVQAEEPPPPPPEVRQMAALAGAPVLGNADAPITIVEYTDFECPFCARGYATSKELLASNPDKIKIVFKHYPLPFHQNAPLAHQAAEAAKMQGKFWEFSDLVFANAKAMSRDDLIAHAKTLELDEAKFIADLDSDAVKAAVAADLADGQKVGVKGTPHFLFNGKMLVGAQPLPAFQKLLDQEYELAKSLIESGTAVADVYAKAVAGNLQAPEIALPPIEIGNSPVKGAADAAVTIIKFSEFECPFCSRVEPTLEQLLKDYDGKIKIVFKNLPLAFHQNAQKAAEAAMAAHAQGKFWEMHDLLFANATALGVDALRGYAEKIGLDMVKFNKELDDGTYAAAVAADAKLGGEHGISGTPSFIINGEQLIGAQPIEAFKAVIDKALAK